MLRFIIAGGATLAIHAALLFVVPENKVIVMPSGANTTSVSIKFLAPSVAQPKALPEKRVTTETPEPVKTIQPDVTPPKTTPKIIKEAPKKVKKLPKKEVSKIGKKISEHVMEKKSQDKPKKVVNKQTEQEPEIQSQAPQKGVNNKPMLINIPSFLSRPTQPRYPRMARRRGIEGVTTYEVWLDENGSQIKQILISSSGELLLDKAALNAIKRWRFSPHTINGTEVAHRVKIPVRFKLDL